MTPTRPQRGMTATHSQAEPRKSRNTNGAGITMVRAAAGRRPQAARARKSGATSATAAVRHGA